MNKDNNINRFSNLSFNLLKEAGWFPGRDILASVKLPEKFEIFSVASEILREFGNLHVGQPGAGIECARSTIAFNPILAEGANDWFSEYEEVLHTNLYPLGEIDDQNMFLAIDKEGRVYIVEQELMFVDENFDQALDKLLTGIKVQLIDDDGNLSNYVP